MPRFVQGQTSNEVQFSHQLVINKAIPYNPSQVTSLPGPRITQLNIPNTGRADFGPDPSPPAVVHSNIQAGLVATQFGQYGQSERSHFSEELYSPFSLDSLPPTDAVLDLMQPHLQLPGKSESFSSQSNLWCNSQTIIQPQQVVTGFQPSRTNSFDSSSCDHLIQSFISQISSSEGAATPMSPRKWIKIKAALKLASVGRLSRASRRGPHRPPAKPRLVPTI